MVDVQRYVRQAYYQLLNGNVTCAIPPATIPAVVPVGDELRKFADTDNIYIILSSQSGVDNRNFTFFMTYEEIVIDIVFKAASRANKQVLDSVANQVIALVLPSSSPAINGLPAQAGMQFLDVYLRESRYMSLALNNSSTVIRRLLTFRQTVGQSSDMGAGITGIVKITGADFTDATNYINPLYLGQTYKVYYNNASKFWDFGTQWVYNMAGGFTILDPPNFNAKDGGIYEFYLLFY